MATAASVPALYRLTSGAIRWEIQGLNTSWGSQREKSCHLQKWDFVLAVPEDLAVNANQHQRKYLGCCALLGQNPVFCTATAQ